MHDSFVRGREKSEWDITFAICDYITSCRWFCLASRLPRNLAREAQSTVRNGATVSLRVDGGIRRAGAGVVPFAWRNARGLYKSIGPLLVSPPRSFFAPARVICAVPAVSIGEAISDANSSESQQQQQPSFAPFRETRLFWAARFLWARFLCVFK